MFGWNSFICGNAGGRFEFASQKMVFYNFSVRCALCPRSEEKFICKFGFFDLRKCRGTFWNIREPSTRDPPANFEEPNLDTLCEHLTLWPNFTLPVGSYVVFGDDPSKWCSPLTCLVYLFIYFTHICIFRSHIILWRFFCSGKSIAECKACEIVYANGGRE